MSCEIPARPATILLAPMEGLLDFVLRDILTRVGGIDRCVSEFIRISDQLLPDRVFQRIVPSCTTAGARWPGCRCARSCWAAIRCAWPKTPRGWPRWGRTALT